MPRYHSKELLRQLRNDLPMDWLIEHLNWPHKRRGRHLIFLCPLCQESNSDVNPTTNLGRCFHCKKNFNPIDFAILVRETDFVEAVDYLRPLLRALQQAE